MGAGINFLASIFALHKNTHAALFIQKKGGGGQVFLIRASPYKMVAHFGEMSDLCSNKGSRVFVAVVVLRYQQCKGSFPLA